MKQLTKLCVEEDVQATAGHVVEVFGEIHFGLTMLYPRHGHGLMLVAEHVFRNE